MGLMTKNHRTGGFSGMAMMKPEGKSIGPFTVTGFVSLGRWSQTWALVSSLGLRRLSMQAPFLKQCVRSNARPFQREKHTRSTCSNFECSSFLDIWVWINTYRYSYIFSGMNIHLPAILIFTRGTRFWPISIWYELNIIYVPQSKVGGNKSLPKKLGMGSP